MVLSFASDELLGKVWCFKTSCFLMQWVKAVERQVILFSDITAATIHECYGLSNVTSGLVVLFSQDQFVTVPRATRLNRCGYRNIMCRCTKILCPESSERLVWQVPLQCPGHPSGYFLMSWARWDASRIWVETWVVLYWRHLNILLHFPYPTLFWIEAYYRETSASVYSVVKRNSHWLVVSPQKKNQSLV